MSMGVLPVLEDRQEEKGNSENQEGNLQVISEIALESSSLISKKKKGRPSVFSPDVQATIKRICPELTTVRSLQNRYYMVRTFNLVRDNPDFSFLHDREHGVFRQTILTELGRIKNDRDLLSMAREICKQRPTSREAVRIIRSSRLQE